MTSVFYRRADECTCCQQHVLRNSIVECFHLILAILYFLWWNTNANALVYCSDSLVLLGITMNFMMIMAWEFPKPVCACSAQLTGVSCITIVQKTSELFRSLLHNTFNECVFFYHQLPGDRCQLQSACTDNYCALHNNLYHSNTVLRNTEGEQSW